MCFSSKIEESAYDCIIELGLKPTNKNINVVEKYIQKHGGGKKYRKIIVFDISGIQKNLYKSILECSKKEQVPVNTINNAIKNKNIVKKTNMRYCYLSDFGKFIKL